MRLPQTERERELHEALLAATGAIDALYTQVDQMKGMFDDSDGAIEQALSDADDAIDLASQTLGRTPRAPSSSPGPG
jgi:hypothetical protein